jgi:hypothetical protein
MRRSTFYIVPTPGPGTPENRDAGKKYLITEVSASQAEEWGLRALMALGTSGIVVPQEISDAGLVGAVLVGFQAFMGAREDAVLPLWREMLPACVQYQPSEGVVHPYREADIEEVSTRLELRKQVLELHTGFTVAELVLKFQMATSARQQNSQTTSISPAP